MQQYYGSYPTQSNYYSQPYDGAGPYNGYTPYTPQPQAPVWGSTPYAPNAGLPPPMQMQSGAPPPTPTAHRSGHRRRTTMPSRNTSQPLKSALKPSNSIQMATPSSPAPLHRKRAMSNPKRDYQSMGMPNAADSTTPFSNQGFHLPEDESTYMFVSFHGTNELHIENLAHKAMDEIRKEIVGMWPGGLELDELQNTQWRLRFKNAPWSLRDENVQWAWRMLVKLFTLFQERGYSYNTTLDVGTSSPRLHFVFSSLSIYRFFLATISNGGRTFTLIDPPMDVMRDLTTGLQGALPGHISKDEFGRLGETNLRIVELRRPIYGGNEITCNQFHCQILRILKHIGYTLCATLPMARKGPLSAIGIGTRQELLVLKSVKGSPIIYRRRIIYISSKVRLGGRRGWGTLIDTDGGVVGKVQDKMLAVGYQLLLKEDVVEDGEQKTLP
ncbi:hypothetical protein F5876DRAFT_61066 [Lentinula aff. lateritia]|uniref:Uncharacterized protein n=1 Tax=Lentinula aff. lateritia TaxID=2804960 RepID=A0ACC1UGR4_9AGAR|nr:hypothetical protein F5876DRAFT_61066 [Lentinula aff. lateritia]